MYLFGICKSKKFNRFEKYPYLLSQMKKMGSRGCGVCKVVSCIRVVMNDVACG